MTTNESDSTSIAPKIQAEAESAKPVRRNRGLLAFLAIVTILIVVAVAAWYYFFVYLPHPSQANRRQLLRWLVEKDLADEPEEIQLALLDRFEEELSDGLKVGDQAAKLSADRHERLHRNVELLKRVWFTSRVEQYHQLAADQRFAFLQKQIGIIVHWTEVEGALHQGTDESAHGSVAGFFDQIDQWIIEANKGEQHDRMLQAVRDGVVCWLATRDLAEQSAETRRDLAMRIAADLDTPGTVESATNNLDAAQRKQLVANGELLLEAWLHDRADRYSKLPAPERTSFLDKQIDSVTKWGVLELLVEQPAGAQNPDAQQIGFVKLVNKWIDRAPSDRRTRLRKLVDDVTNRLVWRRLQNMLPKSQ